ncbi:MAG: XdhC family protein [Bacteroidales bacterium]|nr:XdhC family protein [Bacteroidales bacterium]
MEDIFSKIKEIRQQQKKAALCTIIETHGSAPQKAGAKMIIFEDQRIIGTIGGGSLEKEAMEAAVEMIKKNIPGKFTYELKDDLDMSCGGKVEIFIEPIVQTNMLFVFGAGHVGKAVAELAAHLGFAITVVDERDGIFQEFEVKDAITIQKNYITAIDDLEFNNNTYIVVVTPKHIKDEEVTAMCATKPHAYLGMIGSKNKVAAARENFLKKYQLTREQIDKIDMPIGIKFNALTPAEIALSIVAKLIDVKNNV